MIEMLWMALAFAVFLVELPVLLTEFINTPSGIHKLRLPSVKRMAFVTDFNFDQWVLISVFPLNCFFGFGSRLAQERIVVAHVFENHQAVIVGMDAFFHC